MSFFHHSKDHKDGFAPAPPEKSTPPPPSYTSTIACILLSKSDRLRLAGFPPDVIPVVRAAVGSGWGKGVQREEDYEGTWEFKLNGRPWYGQGDDAIPSRVLMCHVLAALSRIGWQLHTSCDLSKKSYDKDTLFFRLSTPVERHFCAISFNESDKVRLIESPSSDVTSAFTQVISSWAPGIQSTTPKPPSALQHKLRGTPFFTYHGAQVVQTRLLCCRLLAGMEGVGFGLVGSVDMSVGAGGGGSDGEGGDLDTWFFGSL